MWKCIIFLIIYMYFALRSIQILGSIIFLCVCIFYRYMFYNTCILKQTLLILKTSYFWRAQSWMKSTLFYCWGAVQVGSYRTGPPEWRMLGYPPTWPVHPHSCHASSCIPLKKKESVDVEINTLLYFICPCSIFNLFYSFQEGVSRS